jgi:DNA primase
MSELLEIVRPYLKKLKPSGPENIMAICPFHRKPDGTEEHNGSFAMNKYNGLWFCHSCHESGTIRTFFARLGVSDYIVQKYDGVISEAARSLPKKRSSLQPVEPTGGLYLEESFLGLFDKIPEEILSNPEYLADFSPELLRGFDVGFDTTHQRITYPLRDLEGRLIGISGRSLGGGARYKVYDKEYKDWNLPERGTEKRAIIWNAHRVEARLHLATDPSEKYLVIVEGFKGCMRVAAAGIENTVALLNSHPADEQIWWIDRMAMGRDVPIYLMFDNDAAGFQGTLAAGQQLWNHAVNVVLYDREQPSDLQPEEVVDALLSAEKFDSWYCRTLGDFGNLNNI